MTEIEQLITKLDSPIKETVIYIRDFVLGINPLLAVQVKWNSPSFYYTGEMQAFDPKTYQRDLLVLNINRGKILLIFPTGAKIEDQVGGKNYPDGRKIIAVNDLADVKSKEDGLKAIVKDWLSLIG